MEGCNPRNCLPAVGKAGVPGSRCRSGNHQKPTNEAERTEGEERCGAGRGRLPTFGSSPYDPVHTRARCTPLSSNLHTPSSMRTCATVTIPTMFMSPSERMKVGQAIVKADDKAQADAKKAVQIAKQEKKSKVEENEWRSGGRICGVCNDAYTTDERFKRSIDNNPINYRMFVALRSTVSLGDLDKKKLTHVESIRHKRALQIMQGQVGEEPGVEMDKGTASHVTQLATIALDICRKFKPYSDYVWIAGILRTLGHLKADWWCSWYGCETLLAEALKLHYAAVRKDLEATNFAIVAADGSTLKAVKGIPSTQVIYVRFLLDGEIRSHCLGVAELQGGDAYAHLGGLVDLLNQVFPLREGEEARPWGKSILLNPGSDAFIKKTLIGLSTDDASTYSGWRTGLWAQLKSFAGKYVELLLDGAHLVASGLRDVVEADELFLSADAAVGLIASEYRKCTTWKQYFQRMDQIGTKGQRSWPQRCHTRWAESRWNEVTIMIDNSARRL
eukprot:Hpha_TRINITY_DN16572_c1_g1::TRINITY_DN16572_c1_g1_i17::g.133215::m.133215